MLIQAQKTEFLGLIIDSMQLTFSLTPREIKENISTVLKNVQGTQYINFRIDKSNWAIVIQYTSTSRQISISVLQQFQIQALKQNYFYQQLAILDSKGKQKLTCWVNVYNYQTEHASYSRHPR